MSDVQVITGVQKRRRYTDEEKIAMVKETCVPGASVSATARRHGISPSLLFSWRKAFATPRARNGHVPALSETAFVRVLPRHEPDSAAKIAVHLQEEMVIEFPVAIDEQRIARVIRALKETL